MYPRVWALVNKGIFPRELARSSCSNYNCTNYKAFSPMFSPLHFLTFATALS